MSEQKDDYCPFFPDMHCPQGRDKAEQCQVRMQSDFDPVADFKDYQVMECAIFRSKNMQDNKQK